MTTRTARPAPGIVLIDSGVSFEPCAAINASTDVVGEVVTAGGQTVPDYYLHKGYNPVQLTKVTFASGSLWALYNNEQH